MPNRRTTIWKAIFTGVLLVGLRAVGVGYSHQEKAPTKLAPAERQKIHSTLFPGHENGKKLRDIDPGKEIRIVQGQALRFQIPGTTLLKPPCLADAIVLGTVTDQSSALTQKEAFIFSDYTVTVDEILKDNPAAQVDLGESIIVTRPGGSLILDGRRVTTLDEDYKPLEPARRYLLFLQFIPETGAYRGLKPDDVTVENPDQKALDQARQDLMGCRNRGGVR